MYPNMHVIAHLQSDTLIYEALLNPIEQYTKPLAIHILCVHYLA